MTQNNNSWRKTYFTLLAGQAISFISSGILQMAIIFYLVAKTNSAIILTAATLIGFLPQACLGPFAGAFVDRHSRKSVMIGADLIIAAAGGILALVAFYMELPVWSIMVVLLIRSAGTAFHSPAFSAATPMIVPKEELTKCAGYTQTMQAVSAIISPAAAAFLYAVWPLNAIILLDIVGAILACGDCGDVLHCIPGNHASEGNACGRGDRSPLSGLPYGRPRTLVLFFRSHCQRNDGASGI